MNAAENGRGPEGSIMSRQDYHPASYCGNASWLGGVGASDFAPGDWLAMKLRCFSMRASDRLVGRDIA
jgi:hypothetical protein